MAVIREAKRTTSDINTSYSSENKKVPFPWVMLFLCLLVDLIDIILTISLVGIAPWWFFTTFIFTPILIIYINSRDKKFSLEGINTSITTKNEISSAKEYGKISRESKAFSRAGQTEAAIAKTAQATKMASKLPKWLKYLMFLGENIIFLEILPLNSIILLLSYRDNKNSTSEFNKSMLEIMKNSSFKIKG